MPEVYKISEDTLKQLENLDVSVGGRFHIVQEPDQNTNIDGGNTRRLGFQLIRKEKLATHGGVVRLRHR